MVGNVKSHDDKQPTLEQQVAEFQRLNPKVAEAMRLFDITMVQYQGALNAMNAPRMYQSSFTTPLARPQHDELD